MISIGRILYYRITVKFLTKNRTVYFNRSLLPPLLQGINMMVSSLKKATAVSALWEAVRHWLYRRLKENYIWIGLWLESLTGRFAYKHLTYIVLSVTVWIISCSSLLRLVWGFIWRNWVEFNVYPFVCVCGCVGEAMEQGLGDCFRSIRIGKILIQSDEDTQKTSLQRQVPPRYQHEESPPNVSHSH